MYKVSGTPRTNSFILTFAPDTANGVSGTEFTDSYKYEEEVLLPEATGFTKTGYVFGNGDLAGTSYNAGDTYKVVEAKTFIAEFVAMDIEVTFNNDGGVNGATTLNVKYDATIAELANVPTKVGYTFTGYYYGEVKYFNADGSVAEGKTTWDIAEAEVEMKAKYTANTYTVVLDANGGTNGTTITVTYNEVPEKLTQLPSKTGYTFAGWTLTGSGSITSKTPIATVEQTYTYGAGNGTITANWETQPLEGTLTIIGSTDIHRSTSYSTTSTMNFSLPTSITSPLLIGHFSSSSSSLSESMQKCLKSMKHCLQEKTKWILTFTMGFMIDINIPFLKEIIYRTHGSMI